MDAPTVHCNDIPTDEERGENAPSKLCPPHLQQRRCRLSIALVFLLTALLIGCAALQAFGPSASSGGRLTITTAKNVVLERSISTASTLQELAAVGQGAWSTAKSAAKNSSLVLMTLAAESAEATREKSEALIRHVSTLTEHEVSNIGAALDLVRQGDGASLVKAIEEVFHADQADVEDIANSASEKKTRRENSRSNLRKEGKKERRKEKRHEERGNRRVKVVTTDEGQPDITALGSGKNSIHVFSLLGLPLGSTLLVLCGVAFLVASFISYYNPRHEMLIEREQEEKAHVIEEEAEIVEFYEHEVEAGTLFSYEDEIVDAKPTIDQSELCSTDHDSSDASLLSMTRGRGKTTLRNSYYDRVLQDIEALNYEEGDGGDNQDHSDAGSQDTVWDKEAEITEFYEKEMETGPLFSYGDGDCDAQQYYNQESLINYELGAKPDHDLIRISSPSSKRKRGSRTSHGDSYYARVLQDIGSVDYLEDQDHEELRNGEMLHGEGTVKETGQPPNGMHDMEASPPPVHNDRPEDCRERPISPSLSLSSSLPTMNQTDPDILSHSLYTFEDEIFGAEDKRPYLTTSSLSFSSMGASPLAPPSMATTVRDNAYHDSEQFQDDIRVDEPERAHRVSFSQEGNSLSVQSTSPDSLEKSQKHTYVMLTAASIAIAMVSIIPTFANLPPLELISIEANESLVFSAKSYFGSWKSEL